MVKKKYEIVECCFNCSHREERVNSLVRCDLDNKLVNGRLKCSPHYKRTNNRYILSQEQLLLPKGNGKPDTFLVNWLRKVNKNGDS